MYQPHRTIQDETPNFIVLGVEILDEFSIDVDDATEKYLDKTIVVEGRLTSIEDNVITINESIQCFLLESVAVNFMENEVLKVKGRFLGYDELFEELKLDQCSIVRNTN